MRTKALTPARCEGAKPLKRTYTLGDGRNGHGLALRVLPTGTRTWTQRLLIQGKITNIGLGGYPAVGLIDARKLAEENWHKSKVGIDPRRPRQPKPAVRPPRQERIAAGTATVDDCLVEVVNLRSAEWKPTSRANQTRDWLAVRRHLPELLARPVAEVTAREALLAIQSLPSPTMGRAVRMRLTQAVRWAIVNGLRTATNPFEDITAVMPKKPLKHTPHKSLRPEAVANAVAKVREWGESDRRYLSRALALELMVLTGVRAGEAFGAAWAEIESDIWVIPAERMKANREHHVPLTDAAKDVFRRARESGQGPLVFPSPRDGTRMRTARASESLRAAGVGNCSPHGFRASFRTWAGEQGIDRELAELCLAHEIGNAVEQAYKRSDYIERRRAVMAKWADFIVIGVRSG
ncbi:MAG: tyrosine-type recombinase/integrase [Gammaproteobacteria bacterium]|nr:tyrosine-type recombinase/integrase [Gammaproteobacteria bacterium]